MFHRMLDRLEEWIILSFMAVATLVTFVSVAMRYTLGTGFTWSTELTIYLFIWMAKFGAAYGVRTGIHVGVDVLINRMGPRSRGWFILFGLMAGATFTATVGSLGANFVYHMSQTEQVSADMELPMWLVYLAIPCGSYLMCFRFLQVAWRFWRTGELPSHNHAHVEGLESEEPDRFEDINWFEMDDDLHPHDIAHHEGDKGGRS
jgi:C4-dicarboxylate transporter, DctQ subunit